MLEGRELITYHSQRKVTGCYTNIVTVFREYEGAIFFTFKGRGPMGRKTHPPHLLAVLSTHVYHNHLKNNI